MAGKNKVRQSKAKSPASPAQIFKIMIILTFAVGAAFFITNMTAGNVMGMLTIGICLTSFGIVAILMKKLKVSEEKQQLFMSIALVVLVFCISLNSGSYYSDDFPLFLAVIALSGMYLQPLYPLYQGILATVFLLILYFLHPEKADPISQFIMCLVIMDLTAVLLYLLVKRGRAFIEISVQRAKEAEELVNAINVTGEKLLENCAQSSARIDGMKEINASLDGNVDELKKGSEEIMQGTREVDASCEEVHACIQVTGNQIGSLNEEVKKVEVVLAENKTNIREMDTQMEKVKREVADVNNVFAHLNQQMEQIAAVTEQLTGIATSTKMLALNASIEAARAGEQGKGFAVVASKVQDLAFDSSKCSEQVDEIVAQMRKQITETTKQIEESTAAIEKSIQTLYGLEQGFEGLIAQFASLYGNIEEQNSNIKNVDDIFRQLRDRVLGMAAYAEENQATVETIVDATLAYRDYVDLIVEDTKQMNELSADMLESAEKEKDNM